MKTIVSLVSIRTARIGAAPRWWTLMRVVGVIHSVCVLIFAIDIFLELHTVFAGDQDLTRSQVVHLAIESSALALLICGFVISQRELRRLSQTEASQLDTLSALRGHFDDILFKQFETWGLTNAESDIALLSLRGLKIVEIARLRKTKEGTIKAQLSSIFHKAGIGTRTELLGLFMDEFLDFGATQDESYGRTGPSALPKRP